MSALVPVLARYGYVTAPPCVTCGGEDCRLLRLGAGLGREPVAVRRLAAVVAVVVTIVVGLRLGRRVEAAEVARVRRAEVSRPAG